jgi:hypothetical protein
LRQGLLIANFYTLIAIYKEMDTKKHFMICVDNRGYEASLEIRKLYEVLTDRAVEKHQQVRVIDESGEDYLYPEHYFAPIRLPVVTKEKLSLTAA